MRTNTRNFVDDSQIEYARSVDLLTYLNTFEPWELTEPKNGEHSMVSHDSLKISNDKWYQHSSGIGSNNALDFLVKVRRMPFVDAVKTICGNQAVIEQAPSPKPEKKKPNKPFRPPPKAETNREAIAYLQSRGIGNSVIKSCIQEGIIYQNKKYNNLVFLGTDPTGVPRYTGVRSISGSFRGDGTGSDKRYSFKIQSRNPQCERLYVFESPIDALSYATLAHQANPRTSRNATYLSLGGTSSLALDQYLQDYPQTKEIVLCLDNDEPGRNATVRISNELKDNDYLVFSQPSPEMKDYNEYLQHIKKQSRNKQKER